MSDSALKLENVNLNSGLDLDSDLEIDLSDPGALSEEVIAQAVELMKTGRLHRYGEYSGTEPHAALLEQEFAEYVNSRYAVAVNSGGCAIFLALKVAGVNSGDAVLVNAFNLAPVPGAIHHAGANAVLVEIDHDHRINIDDLKRKAKSSGAKVLLLTHMRGHIADMTTISNLCEELGLTLVEDCAHTMGAKWDGKFTGRYGALGCFSTQTFKHINSGEGGILVCDDEDMAAKAILYSGSYMLYGQHQSSPSEAVFEKWKKTIPNFSMRMSNLVACILRPQLKEMEARGQRWNEIYRWLENRLNQIDGIEVPFRHSSEEFVASSIQFHVSGLNTEQLQTLSDHCTERGVAIKWFGRNEPLGYTSQYHHWQYLEPQDLPETRDILATTCDMRIPLSLTEAHCNTIAAIISDELSSLTL
jgi:dTDP-4-amino-4,6-dideoxygalactose transaminase